MTVINQTVVLLVLLSAAEAYAQQPIETRVLKAEQENHITIHPNVATTLLFPSPVGGTFGLGLVSLIKQGNGSGEAPVSGVVQMDHPENSPVMVLHALTNNAKVMMTVLLDGRLYVFDVEAGSQPDIAITYVKTDPQVPRAQEVTANDVIANRLKFNPELLDGYLRRARDAEVMRKSYPELYQDYNTRTANYTSESDSAITTVTSIHRFSNQDVVVLEGTVQNKLGTALLLDPRSTTVQVANEVHPAKLTDVQQPIPAGQTVPIAVVLQGDWDASRAHLSIENEFRIILPAPLKETPGRYQAEETGRGLPPRFKVPRPAEGKEVIPRTQTGP
jgi:hypothetical protein